MMPDNGETPQVEAKVVSIKAVRGGGADLDSGLIRKNGAVTPAIKNARHILERHTAWAGILAWNEFAQRVTLLAAPPYHVGAHFEPRALEELDAAQFVMWASGEGYPEFPIHGVRSAMEAVARDSGTYHPVRAYLESLVWDGTPRINQWMQTYLGVAQSRYAELAGSWWLMSGVARIMAPGCDAHHMLILEGEQGIGKSTVFKDLAGKWSLSTLIDLSNKEAYMLMHGYWVIEMAELSAMRKTDRERVYQFITESTTAYVPKYQNTLVDYPRHFILAGSTNKKQYLHDAAARRFWPVECTRIDNQALRRARDQLWAEALVRYNGWRECVKMNETHKGATGEYAEDLCRGENAKCADHRWHPEAAEQRMHFSPHQGERHESDSWTHDVEKFLDRTTAEVTSVSMILHGLEIPLSMHNKSAQDRVADIMAARRNEWERAKVIIGGARVWGYRKVAKP